MQAATTGAQRSLPPLLLCLVEATDSSISENTRISSNFIEVWGKNDEKTGTSKAKMCFMFDQMLSQAKQTQVYSDANFQLFGWVFNYLSVCFRWNLIENRKKFNCFSEFLKSADYENLNLWTVFYSLKRFLLIKHSAVAIFFHFHLFLFSNFSQIPLIGCKLKVALEKGTGFSDLL